MTSTGLQEKRLDNKACNRQCNLKTKENFHKRHHSTEKKNRNLKQQASHL